MVSHILCTGMCVRRGFPEPGRSCKRLGEEHLRKVLGVPTEGAEVERCVYLGSGWWLAVGGRSRVPARHCPRFLRHLTAHTSPSLWTTATPLDRGRTVESGGFYTRQPSLGSVFVPSDSGPSF